MDIGTQQIESSARIDLRGWRAYDLEITEGELWLRGAWGTWYGTPTWDCAQLTADPAPSAENHAGIYLADSPLTAGAYGSILAFVAGWGKHVLHAHGARVEHCKILQLHVPESLGCIRFDGKTIAEELERCYEVPVLTVPASHVAPSLHIEASSVELDPSAAVHSRGKFALSVAGSTLYVTASVDATATIKDSTIEARKGVQIRLRDSEITNSTVTTPLYLAESRANDTKLLIRQAINSVFSHCDITADAGHAHTYLIDCLVRHSTVTGFRPQDCPGTEAIA